MGDNHQLDDGEQPYVDEEDAVAASDSDSGMSEWNEPAVAGTEAAGTDEPAVAGTVTQRAVAVSGALPERCRRCDQTLEKDLPPQLRRCEVLAWNPTRILIVGGPHDPVLAHNLTVGSLTTGGRSYWCRVYHVR